MIFVKKSGYERKCISVIPITKIINKALSLTDEKMKAILQDTDEVTLKKVLKKNKNDSTMDIDVFVITMEEIGEQKLIE